MRSFQLTALVGLVVAVCCSCGAGPSDRPVVAVVEKHAGNGDTSTPANPADEIPELQKPKADVTWRECTNAMINVFGLAPGPTGLILECGDFTAPVDQSGVMVGNLPVGLLRARLPQTPTDVLPLVLTSGADRPSTDTLASMVTGTGSSILQTRPIVAIDRRGIGNSQPIDCIPLETRRVLGDLGQFDGEGSDPADRVTTASEAATQACRDYLDSREQAFDTAHAADDLNQLRLIWQVDGLAILGTGNGARVALSYAAKYPANVARLILDAPEGVGLDGQTLTENRLRGQEAALTAFASRCAALSCSLGADPRAAIQTLVDRAGAGQLGTISANALLAAISGFIGSPRTDQPDRVAVLADALSSAGRGDYAALTAIVTREQATTDGDGQYVNRCSDTQVWPTPQKARELQATWAGQYPVFGRAGALETLVCAAWPVGTAAKSPENLKIPVLVLTDDADPVTGSGGLGTVTGALTNAGAKVAAITWQGFGHPVGAHSVCAQEAEVKYLDSGALPENGTVCPA